MGVCWEDSWESLGQRGDQTSQSLRKSTLNVLWKNWIWSSNTLATWCKELTHWKRPCCWERLRAGGEGGNRGWDGWMASLTQWTWVWVSSGNWWWTGRPGLLQSMGSQRVGHDWVAELNWTGKIPHASEQLSPCITTTEPVLWSPCVPELCSTRRQATAMRSPCFTVKGSPYSLPLEKALTL